MFKFLKNKIKDAVDKFRNTTEEQTEEVAPEELTPEEEQQLQQEEQSVKQTPKPQEEADDKEQEATQPDEKSQEEPREDVQEEIPEELKEKPKKELVTEDQPKEPSPQPEPEVTVEVQEEPQTKPQEVVQEEVPVEPKAQKKQAEEKEELAKEQSPSVSDVALPTKPSSDAPVDVSVDADDKASDEDIAEEYHAPKRGFLGRIFHKAKEEVEEKEEAFAEKELESGDFKEPPKPKPKKEELQPEPVKEQKEKPVETVTEPAPRVHPKPVEEVKKETEPHPDEQPAGKAAVHKDLLQDDVTDATQKKKGFLSKLKERVVRFQLTEEKFEEVFWEFELALMENNVAVQVIEKIKKDMHDKLTRENVSRKSVEQVILDTLKDSIKDVLDVESFDLLEKIKTKQPFIIAMVGVNGSGKTTALAKLVKLFQKNNLSMVVAAADTFRAAAIQQLEEHTTKLGVKLIKHDYNADPAAVAFDAVKHAKAKGLDVVLIDTAGRLQSNSNLMDELKKLIRVNKPDLNIFVGESITGNDCVEQAVAFNEAVGIDGIILSKADVDEKGGAALSVSYVTKKPILFIGTGQTYDDLKPFSKEEVLANLGL